MSDETDDDKYRYKTSDDAQHVLDDSPRDTDIELPRSRMSSASKKSEEQRTPRVNEFSDQTRIKSPLSSRQDTNQLDNNKLRKNNQSSFNSFDDDEQRASNTNSRSSVRANEPSNDGPTTNYRRLNSSSYGEQNKLNLNGNSVDTTSKQNQQDSHRTRNPSNLSKYLPGSFFPVK